MHEDEEGRWRSRARSGSRLARSGRGAALSLFEQTTPRRPWFILSFPIRAASFGSWAANAGFSMRAPPREMFRELFADLLSNLRGGEGDPPPWTQTHAIPIEHCIAA